jgi:hypothetical protein
LGAHSRFRQIDNGRLRFTAPLDAASNRIALRELSFAQHCNHTEEQGRSGGVLWPRLLTTATAIFTQTVPDNDSVLISASAAAFVGGPGVTTSTGFPVAANTPVLIPTTGAEVLQLYGVVSSGTATISYLSTS